MQQQHCKQLVYIYREGKDILLEAHPLDCLSCDIKAKTDQATAIQKEFSQSCVKTHCV